MIRIDWKKVTKIIVTLIITILVFTYTIGIVLGYIDAKNRIDGVNLSVILITTLIISLLWWPQAFENITGIEISNILKITKDVKKLQDNQEQHKLMLPLLLPEKERRHLVHLLENRTSAYGSSSYLRNDLRHLRSMGLIEMCNNYRIADIKGLPNFDLASYVRLTTPTGIYWARECKKLESQLEDSSNGD